MLTPASIRSTKAQSGYHYVQQVGGQPSRGKSPIYFQAIVTVASGGGPGNRWVGPGRRTALEAAQDYCDYINSGRKHVSRALKRAGHKRPQGRKVRKPAEVLDAEGVLRDFRAQQEGVQGYVYCFREAEGVERYVKIGYSTNPPKRIAEVQTGNPRVLELVGYFEGTEADERALHARFRHANKLQEWFRPVPALLSMFTSGSRTGRMSCAAHAGRE